MASRCRKVRPSSGFGGNNFCFHLFQRGVESSSGFAATESSDPSSAAIDKATLVDFSGKEDLNRSPIFGSETELAVAPEYVGRAYRPLVVQLLLTKQAEWEGAKPDDKDTIISARSKCLKCTIKQFIIVIAPVERGYW